MAVDSGTQAAGWLNKLLDSFKTDNADDNSDEEVAQKISNDIAANVKEIRACVMSYDCNEKVFSEKELDEIGHSVDSIDRKLNAAGFIDCDIRRIDEKYLKIACQYKDAFRIGRKNAVKTCLAALETVDEIRKLPDSCRGSEELYIKTMCGYLDKWLLLIAAANRVDINEQTVEQISAEYREAKKETEIAKSKLMDELKENREALNTILNLPRGKWTDREYDLHRRSVDLTFKQHLQRFSQQYLDSLENDLIINRQNMKKLRLCVAQVPLIEENGLSEQTDREIQELIDKMFRTDTEIKNAVSRMNEQSGQLDALNEAGGTRAMDRLAAKTLGA